MNKKPDYELILKMYYVEKKSYFRISKELELNKSTIGYVVQSSREGQPYKDRQNKNREINKPFRNRYADSLKNIQKLENELKLLKEQYSKLLDEKIAAANSLPMGIKRD